MKEILEEKMENAQRFTNQLMQPAEEDNAVDMEEEENNG